MELVERLVKEYNDGFSAGHNSAMRECEPPPEPTDLTRDQAIRAKALECAVASTTNHITPRHFVQCAIVFEDYIRDGRKGDE